MTTSKCADEDTAISMILTRTQRLLQIETDKQDSAFHKAQLLLSEYIVMLTDTQTENNRLRRLLGSYIDSQPAARNLPASTVIAQLQGSVRVLRNAVATLRGALERIQASECEAAERNPGEIAAHALREIEALSSGAGSG